MNSLHQHVSIFPLLANALHDLLQGYQLKDAYRNQESTELNLVFQNKDEQVSIQLNTEAKTGLFFFYEYPLERSGAVFPLYRDLIGSNLNGIFAHQNNRSFQLNFGSDQCLVFKLYGPLSNVIYYKQKEVLQLFRAGIENDRFLKLDEFNQEILPKELPIFQGKYLVYELNQKTKEFVLCFEPIEGICLLETEVIFEALSVFSKYYLQEYVFQTHKNRLLGQYKQKVKRDSSQLYGAQQFLKHAAEAVPFDEIGHIIMANIHTIQKGEKEVILDDFYRNTPISIALKKDLSPQDNAAYYYHKAKNRKLEIVLKQKQLEACLIKLEESKILLQKIEKANNLRDLRPWIKEEKTNQTIPLKEKFRRFEHLGFQIYVGKNAKNNDELTLKFAHKEDMWLHAKGVSGSHVVIKHKPKQGFPEQVINKAAEIAAYYSSAAGSQLVPVLFALKKFVRKPKGAHAGQVSVEREEITMVEPKL